MASKRGQAARDVAHAPRAPRGLAAADAVSTGRALRTEGRLVDPGRGEAAIGSAEWTIEGGQAPTAATIEVG